MKDRTIAEALWVGFKHEAMHLKIFLYMLLQSDRTILPIGVETPDFRHMSSMAKNKKPNSWFHIPQQTLTVGLDEPNAKIMPKDSFGWDNEKPQRTISVHMFEAQAGPITNEEYAKYLQANGLREYPTSWVLVCEDKEYPIPDGVTQSNPSASEDFLNNFAVRTVFGPVSLDLAQNWSLISSYDEVASYAKWVGCRIPTFEEAKSIYAYSDKLQGGTSNGASDRLKVTKQRAPQMAERSDASSNGANGFLSHGISIYWPSLFRDFRNSNIGFKHWHPIPVTPNGDKLAGQGDMGGVWEWTSSPLLPYEGFKPMEIYPGYTCELLYTSPDNYPEMLTLNYSGFLRLEA